ncbi:MAG: GGDEF domain-containing protein [Alphaproteobacteria bacterium]
MAQGERALNLLKQLRSPAVPRNYEILYAFASSVNKDLCDDLRKALETDGCFTEETAQRLSETYFNKKRMDEKVDKVGSQVSQEMSDIMSVIQAASERTGSYGESLQNVNARLFAIESPQQLKSVLDELFETTNDMAEYNDLLEKRLEKSKSQIDELQLNLELTRAESFTDALTGLTNRKRFDQTIELEITEAKGSGDPMCLLMMDIDHFKTFNDRHGHQTGDQVLRLVATTLKTNVKGRDCVARYGGEEFVIILPKTKLSSAMIVAEQIRKAVKVKQLVKKSTNESIGHVTLSIGVAVYRTDESIQELIERADSCLYASKKAGRNTVKSEKDLNRAATPKAESAINAA